MTDLKSLLDEATPLTDSVKLKVLALWFDTYDERPLVAKRLLAESAVETRDPSEVQRDLRRIAERLPDFERAVDALWHVRNRHVEGGCWCDNPKSHRYFCAETRAALYRLGGWS